MIQNHLTYIEQTSSEKLCIDHRYGKCYNTSLPSTVLPQQPEQDYDNDENDDEGGTYQEEIISHEKIAIMQDRFLTEWIVCPFGTFHSICSRTVRLYGSELSTPPSVHTDTLDGTYTIMDQNDQTRLIKECLDKCSIGLKGASQGKDIRPTTIINAVTQLKSDDILTQTSPLLSAATVNNRN